jgi:hypothetical protein
MILSRSCLRDHSVFGSYWPKKSSGSNQIRIHFIFMLSIPQVRSSNNTGNFAVQPRPPPGSSRANHHSAPLDHRRTHNGGYATGINYNTSDNQQTGWSKHRALTPKDNSSSYYAANHTGSATGWDDVQWPEMGDTQQGLSRSLGMGDTGADDNDDDDDALLGSIDMPEEEEEGEREGKRMRMEEKSDKENTLLAAAPFVYLAAIQQEISRNPSRKFVVTIKVPVPS